MPGNEGPDRKRPAGPGFAKEIAPGITQVSHLGAKELNEAMLASDMVLSRSGYTTLMDLAKLNKKAILIPTPGQSEQEYLGKYLMKKGYFYSLPQSAVQPPGKHSTPPAIPLHTVSARAEHGSLQKYRAGLRENALKQRKFNMYLSTQKFFIVKSMRR